MIRPGTLLGGRYEILEHIGSGGMADVYKAKCHKLNRYVAIKILRPEYNEDDAFVRRFIAEAQATAGLNHPNIVNIYDADHDQGYHYIVMELAEGMTLKRYIRRYGRLSVRETVDFAIQIAYGIEAAHERHIIHRDIKPQNILVSDSGKVKVADFGIARAANGDTISQSTIGSVHYLSPEQARGGYADERSDIYSLGITIYEMATGKVPFDGENGVAVALMHLQEDITPPRCYFPDIPASLENIIMKCTMKQPGARYQSAKELIDDLKKVFVCPEGNYVYGKPLIDDSPTVTRSQSDIEKIKENLAKKEEKKAEAVREEQPEESLEDLYDDDDDTTSSHMRKLIYFIVATGSILLIGIIIYLIISAKGMLPSDNVKPINSTTKETTSQTTTQVKRVEMPDLLKETKEDAEEKLADLGLKARFSYHDGVDENADHLIVVEQQYEKGKEIPENTIVELTLDTDPEATTENIRVEVPSFVNYTEEAAQKELDKLGLGIKKVYATSDTVKEGYIIKQSPKGGSIVDKGFAITLTISKGVSQVRVPTLSGLSQSAAEKELNNVGLYLGDVSSGYSGSVGVGEVIEQGIDSGTMVDKGTKVPIVISLGEQVSYHYEGNVYIEKSPFEDAEQHGSVKVDVDQDGEVTTIYQKDDISSASFPLDITFKGKKEGEATVTMYVNGEKYDTFNITINAVAD